MQPKIHSSTYRWVLNLNLLNILKLPYDEDTQNVLKLPYDEDTQNDAQR